MRNKEIILLFASLFLSLSFASAEILMGQTNQLYSFGDNFNISIVLNPSSTTNNFLIVKLICGSTEAEIHKSAQSILSGRQKIIPIDINLDTFFIGNASGICFIKAEYGVEKAESRRFEITKSVNVVLDVSGIFFEPGKQFRVSGTAKKANGDLLQGYVEITIPSMNLTTSSIVSSGIFNFNLTVPSDAPAGTYALNARAYEKNTAGDILNEGSAVTSIKIKQVIESLEIALNTNSVYPLQEFLYTILLYDQSGEKAVGEASVFIYSPDNSLFIKKVVSSSVANSLKIESNFTPGYWNIESTLDKINGKRIFYVEEVENATFEIINNTLIIKNTGNVPYKKPIEIAIGDTPEIKEVEVNVGSEKKLNLYAPDGEYNIKVSDGKKTEEIGSVFLTGKSVAVKDDKESTGSKSSLILWTVVILFLSIIAIKYYDRISKKPYFGKTPSSSKNSYYKNISSSVSENGDGNKEESVIISLCLKNEEDIGSESSASSSIEKVLNIAESKKAKVYSQPGFKIIILSPSLTGKEDNLLEAIKLAKEIENLLNERNKKNALKIDFGIGVNSGEMIIEKHGEKVKFTSLGNTTMAAKNASKKAHSETFISKAVQRKVYGITKTKAISENMWKLYSIIDREQHSEFIKRFMKK